MGGILLLSHLSGVGWAGQSSSLAVSLSFSLLTFPFHKHKNLFSKGMSLTASFQISHVPLRVDTCYTLRHVLFFVHTYLELMKASSLSTGEHT